MRPYSRMFLFAQGMDMLTFAMFFLLIPMGGQFSERNPIVAFIFNAGGNLFYGLGMAFAVGGVLAVFAFKMGLASHIAWQAEHIKPIRHPRFLKGMLMIGLAFGVVGAGFNFASFLGSI